MLTEFIETNEGFIQDFDLSCFRSLRSLEVTASSVSQTRADAPYLLRDIFSTITSPDFSEIILVFQRPDLYRPYQIPFEVFREMYSKRKFRLVFCLEVLKKYRAAGWEVMRQRLDSEIAQRRLDFLSSPPTLAVRGRNFRKGG